MKVPFYVHQHPNFALGNFINCTPTIRYLAHKYGERIPVLFDTEYVRQCFLDCPFIEIIDAPRGKRLFGSELKAPRRSRWMDCEYIFRQVIGKRWTPEWHTYVDRPQRTIEISDTVVLINGSGSERQDYIDGKDPGAHVYTNACLASHHTTFVGSWEDAKRNHWLENCEARAIGDIRDALSVISSAVCVIANDTGLAHAAGAMNKPLLVLWKNTPFPRCSNPGINTQYAFNNHEQAVRDFLSNIQAASSGKHATADLIHQP